MDNDVDIDHLARLCRIKCTDNEKQKLQVKLDKVLGYMQLLEEVDTEGVEPCSHVLETMKNIMAEDEMRSERMSRKDFLENAPDQVGGMIKVPSVIQFEE